MTTSHKKLIRYKKISWQRNILRKLEEIELKDPKEYWNIIDKLKGETDNTFITNPKKFECFFKDLFSNKIINESKQKFHIEIEEIVKTKLNNVERNVILDPDIDLNELKRSLLKLKNNKSPGPDGIPADMIKQSPERLIKLILKLINKIKHLYYYPENWAVGITSLLLKDGNDEDPNNYRAITICNAMSKIFSIIIYERILLFVEDNNIIGNYQIGFKKRARPSDHLFVLKNCIDKYIQNGKRSILAL